MAELSVDNLLAAQPEKPVIPAPGAGTGESTAPAESGDSGAKDTAVEQSSAPDSGALDANLVDTPDDSNV